MDSLQKISFKKQISNTTVRLILLCVSFFPFFTSAQVVKEIVQVDTVAEVINVVYKPIKTTSYYFKKIAVFAADTNQVAVEKSFTSYAQNGVYKAYYPSGRLKIKTVYANNNIHGEWVYYNPEGIIIVKGKYREGIKHGFWAYKSLKIFGRYKKGNKHKRWKRFDENEDKHISHYKHGVLTAGEGYGGEVPMYGQKQIKEEQVEIKDSNSIIIIDTNKVSKVYQQAISFLRSNSIFRRALKNHLGNSLKESIAIKKLYGIEGLEFAISSKVTALDMSKFITVSEKNQIVVAKIDSILKSERINIKQMFSGEVIAESELLQNNSIDIESPMEFVFSELAYNLLRIDAVWTFKEEARKFQILLYYDDKGVLRGAEYEKR